MSNERPEMIRDFCRLIREYRTRCERCGAGKQLETHHFFDWRLYPELARHEEAVTVFCFKCHELASRLQLDIEKGEASPKRLTELYAEPESLRQRYLQAVGLRDALPQGERRRLYGTDLLNALGVHGMVGAYVLTLAAWERSDRERRLKRWKKRKRR